MIVDLTDGKLDEVNVFAHENGISDTLNRGLEFLDHFAEGEDKNKSKVELYRDFADHSFYFLIYMRKDPSSEYVRYMNGGLIYHSYCREWSIHT